MLATTFSLSIYTFYAGKRFDDVVERMDGFKAVRVATKTASRRISLSMGFFAFGLTVYACMPRYPAGYIQILSVHVGYLSSMVAMFTIVQYCGFDATRTSPRKVCPNGTVLASTVGDAMPIQSEIIQTSVPTLVHE